MTSEKIEISVVLCTYNREALLTRALDSILNQGFPSDRFEVLVVDNNSTDGTPEVVQRAAGTANSAVRYLFEGRQGKSYALNRGILEARGPLLAFADDDERVAPDWLEQIDKHFNQHQPDLIGGRTLPDWSGEFPDWFHPEYRSVIGVFSPSMETMFVDLDWPSFPGGGNLSARAEVFHRFGGFREDLSCLSLHRGEDTELIQRVLKKGGRVLYAPDVVVHHYLPKERLTRRYVRRWYERQGMANSRMYLDEEASIPKIFGIPRWRYRCFLEDLGRLIWGFMINPRSRLVFYHETRLWRFYGFVKDRWTRRRSEKRA